MARTHIVQYTQLYGHKHIYYGNFPHNYCVVPGSLAYLWCLLANPIFGLAPLGPPAVLICENFCSRLR